MSVSLRGGARSIEERRLANAGAAFNHQYSATAHERTNRRQFRFPFEKLGHRQYSPVARPVAIV
jgi:hypothetical protein